MLIYIDDLAIRTTIGVLAWEKQIQQTLFLSLELTYDAEQAQLTDRIEDALDYTKISQTIFAYCEQNTHNLLESLAYSLGNLLLTTYPINQLKIKLRKPQAIFAAKDVGVIVNLTAKTSLLT